MDSSKSIIISIPADVLFNIFQLLDLKQRLLHRRICRRWLNESQSLKNLWNGIEMDEDEDEEDGLEWSLSRLSTLDRISQSSLRRVRINWLIPEEDVQPLITTLEKSKDSLQVLHLNVFGDEVANVIKLSNVSWKIPGLIDFRVPGKLNSVNLHNETGEKVLWTWSASQLSRHPPQYFDNLVSLKVHYSRSAIEWRKLLEGPSKTLKHLEICFDWYIGKQAGDDFSPLIFPKLKVLRRHVSSEDYWLKTPNCSMVMCSNEEGPPKGLTSLEELWIEDPLYGWGCPSTSLLDNYPNLKKMRWRPDFTVFEKYRSHGNRAVFDWDRTLAETIQQRRESVENGTKVDGIRMKMIETVMIWRIYYDELSEVAKEELDKVEELILEDVDRPSKIDFEI